MRFRGLTLSTVRRECDKLQERFYLFMHKAFAAPNVDPGDPDERAKRFFEEATELFQATHSTAISGTDARAMAHRMVDHVFDKPVGDVYQEFGGVELTAMALARVCGVSKFQAGVDELERVEKKYAENPAFFSARSAAKADAGI